MAWQTFNVPGNPEKQMRFDTVSFAIEVLVNGEWISCYKAGFQVTPGVVASVNEEQGTCQVKTDPASASTVSRYYRLKTPVVGEAGLMIDSIFLPTSLFQYGGSGEGGGAGGGKNLPALVRIPIPIDADNDSLVLVMDFSTDATFRDCTRITTEKNHSAMAVFGRDTWQSCPSKLGLPFFGSSVAFELSADLIKGYVPGQKYFVRYCWADSSTQTGEWYGMIVQ